MGGEGFLAVGDKLILPALSTRTDFMKILAFLYLMLIFVCQRLISFNTQMCWVDALFFTQGPIY